MRSPTGEGTIVLSPFTFAEYGIAWSDENLHRATTTDEYAFGPSSSLGVRAVVCKSSGNTTDRFLLGGFDNPASL
jgi:hypothetical protein